jgi:hypothetical protein
VAPANASKIAANTMTRPTLACSGWIPEQPRGNRLHWLIPPGATPTELHLQRSPLKLPPEAKQSPADVTRLAGWWRALDPLDLRSPVPHVTWTLPVVAQGLAFRFHGPTPTICIVKDALGGKRVGRRLLRSGETVLLRAGAIGEIVFATETATLEDISLLDLYAERTLAWKTIAKIASTPEVPASLDDALTRLSGAELPGEARALSAESWSSLADLAAGIVAAGEPDELHTPTARQRFELLRGGRFWFAVLTGSGFVDGTPATPNTLDTIETEALLDAPAAVAYRVIDPSGTLPATNIVASAPAPIGPLRAPRHATARGTVTFDRARQTFVAHVDVSWQRPQDPAIGALVEHGFSGSERADAPPATAVEEYRTASIVDETDTIVVSRHDDVASWDVTTHARVAALDGWDRVGPWTVLSPESPLQLRHTPTPPRFASATQTPNGVLLDRAETTWEPDAVVAATGGSVALFRRRTTEPLRAAVVLTTEPATLPDGSLRMTLDRAIDHDTYIGGRLITGAGTHTVLAIGVTTSGTSTLDVEVAQSAEGSMIVPPAGPATLVQRDSYPDLWTRVAAFPALGFPRTVELADPWGPRDGLRIYAAAIEFDPGDVPRVGPIGPSVLALGFAAPPAAPPQLSATAMVTTTDGRSDADYYGRTLVQITFPDALAGADTLKTSWAEGDADALRRYRAPGLLPPKPVDGTQQFADIMPLPLPLPHTITIGAQLTDPASGLDGQPATATLATAFTE